MANSSGKYSHFSGVDATLVKINGTQVTATAAELNKTASVTGGTVAASKAVVVDANKDITSFRNLTATTLIAGASGAVGNINVFPATASKGKTNFTASDNTGDTVTTINTALQATTRAYTIPDAGADASFVMTQGAQTIAGATTFSSNILIGVGKTIDLDSSTATLSSNAATITKYSAVITTESLTTAGAASQAFTITMTGLVAAGDLAFVQWAGGTNSATKNITFAAVCSTNTVTVTVYNNTAATALNGTLIFNLLVFKA